MQEDKERFPIQVGPAFQAPSWNLFTPTQDWTKVLNEPHFSSLFIDNAWRKVYNDLPDMDVVKELGVDIDEVSKGAVNRAYLSRVIGVTPEELEPTYEGWLNQFAQENLGGPVLGDVDFFDRMAQKAGEGTVEAGARFTRGVAVGTNQTEAGFYTVVEGLLRGERNPYFDKTTAEAQADVPRLKGEIGLAEQEMDEGRAHGGPRGFVPPAGSRAARMGDLKTRLGWAELAAKGQTPENILGSLSRSSGDLAEDARERAKEDRGLFSGSINSAHNDWWVMRVAEGAGESAPGLVASAMNPVFAAGVSYAQNYEAAVEEYKQAAEQRGANYRPEDADRYAHKQALLQTPFDLIGNVSSAKAIAKEFQAMPKDLLKEGPTSYGNWLGKKGAEIAKGPVVQTAVTAPMQTTVDSLVAENEGVRDKTSWEEKRRAGIESAIMGLGQIGLTVGGPILLLKGLKAAKEKQSPTSENELSVAAFLNDAQIRINATKAEYGNIEAYNAITPKLVQLSRLTPPLTRPFAKPEKLERHGIFDWKKYDPIIVEEHNGVLTIQEGMTRFENAKRSGITELPAYVFPRR